MYKKLTQFILLLGSLLILTASLLFGQNERDAYRIESFSTNDSPAVDIQTSGGSISVYGHDSNEVKVVMYASRGRNYLSPSDTDLSDFDIDISQSGNRITAYANREGKWSNIFRSDKNISISFEVYAPTGSSVDGKTSGGSVSAENFHNELNLKTSGGSVSAKNSTGTIALSTSGGSVNLDDVTGTISAKTSGGSLNINRVFGTADLKTSGGSVRINDSGGKLTASTSGGSITADFSEFSDDISLRTSGGNIRINLPQADHFDLDLSGMRVQTELRNFTGSSERNSIKGRVGEGGPKVTAKTSGGRVELSYHN